MQPLVLRWVAARFGSLSLLPKPCLCPHRQTLPLQPLVRLPKPPSLPPPATPPPAPLSWLLRAPFPSSPLIGSPVSSRTSPLQNTDMKLLGASPSTGIRIIPSRLLLLLEQLRSRPLLPLPLPQPVFLSLPLVLPLLLTVVMVLLLVPLPLPIFLSHAPSPLKALKGNRASSPTSLRPNTSTRPQVPSPFKGHPPECHHRPFVELSNRRSLLFYI